MKTDCNSLIQQLERDDDASAKLNRLLRQIEEYQLSGQKSLGRILAREALSRHCQINLLELSEPVARQLIELIQSLLRLYCEEDAARGADFLLAATRCHTHWDRDLVIRIYILRGEIAERQRNSTFAESLYLSAYRLASDLPREESALFSLSARRLSFIYAKQERFNEALQTARQSLFILRTIVSPPEEIASLSAHLGAVLFAAGKKSDAAPQLVEAAWRYEALGASFLPCTVEVIELLSEVCEALGEHRRARRYAHVSRLLRRELANGEERSSSNVPAELLAHASHIDAQ